MAASAEIIRRARVSAGLTQTELARRAGTSQPAVARYEAGVASPAVRTLERLLRVLGTRVDLVTTPAGTSINLAGERMHKLRKHRPQIQEAVRRAGATNVRVFGSVIRGEDRPDSDVDVLVDFDVSVHGALPLIRLQRELSELLDDHVEIAAPELLRPEIAERITMEAIPL